MIGAAALAALGGSGGSFGGGGGNGDSGAWGLSSGGSLGSSFGASGSGFGDFVVNQRSPGATVGTGAGAPAWVLPVVAGAVSLVAVIALRR